MDNMTEFIRKGERTAKILLCGESQSLQEMLLKNQLDFFLIEPENLKGLDLKKIEAVIIEPENLSKICMEELKDIKDIKIFTFAKPDFLDDIKKFAGFIKICRDENNLVMSITANITPDVFLRKQADIFYIKKEVSNGYHFIFANGSETNIKTKTELFLPGDYSLTEYNSETDEKISIDFEIKNDITTFELNIKSGETKILCAEKN